MHDAVSITRDLIRCPSVTPDDAGAQDVLATALERIGFAVTRLPFGATPNQWARLGTASPHFSFAGHTDVVPAVVDGVLHGRGAVDMKGAIAAFVAACETRAFPGSVSLLITGDEEGPATDGTVRVLEWIEAHGHVPDFCLVGEPTNPARLGEVIKIGRRGSLNAAVIVHGTQGHVAYPDRADNPVHRLVAALGELLAAGLDAGSEWFEPSTLQVTSVDVGNTATNVVPAAARARLNIRFNDHHTGAGLRERVAAVLARHAPRHELDVSVSGESFLTQPGPDVERLRRAVAAATGLEPRLDTGGGTSDARFIARLCPVAEFGLVGATMHQVDERVPVAELRALAGVYGTVLDAFLGNGAA